MFIIHDKYKKVKNTSSLPRSSGFTIVELLIVIVVIGILATISITTYNGIQERAIIAVLKSDLRNAATQLEIAKIDNADQYPGNTDGIRKSEGTTFEYTSTGTAFCLTATSDRDGIPAFRISSSMGVEEGTCPGH